MQDTYILRLKQRDQGVISDLYDAYSSALYGVVLRIVQTPELAEQVLQDTFVKIWRNSDSYDPGKGRLFTWMLNIARNTAIDATRTRHFQDRRKTETPDKLVYQSSSDNINPDHVGLHELVGKLDDKYSSVVDLIYFKGYTQEEAAEVTGIPLGTVKTRLRFAIQELRRAFGPAVIAALLIF